MAKKNKSQKDIITAYMQHVLEHSSTPESVYKFGKDNGFNEAEFYNFFGTFESLEKSIFRNFFDNTMILLEKNEEYQNFDAQNKLLSFYFTFFEVLKANRSYVIMTLSTNKASLKTHGVLVGLKELFKKFVDGLDIQTLDLKQEKWRIGRFKRIIQEICRWIGYSNIGFKTRKIGRSKAERAFRALLATIIIYH